MARKKKPENEFLNPFLNDRMPEEREFLVNVFIPALVHSPGTLLYVGASPGRFACANLLRNAGHEITVLEIWPAYIDELRPRADFVAHWVPGDVRNVDSLPLPHAQYDYTFWWHGPEHISRQDVEPTIRKLEELTTRLISLATPWGRVAWPAEDGNPYMEHACSIFPRDFARWGYRYVAVWPENRTGSHVMAWKKL